MSDPSGDTDRTITTPLELDRPTAQRWAELVGRGLDVLRLNRHFPDWGRVRDHVAAAAATSDAGGLRIDRESGLPVPREWMRVRVETELGGAPSHALPSGALLAREVHVALRHVIGDRASYAVRVDRLDVASATVTRYSLVLGDTPGRVVSAGELALYAATRFQRQLELLSTQDAALAFAVLRDQEGLEVEEVVRGVVGPAALAAGDPLLPDRDPGCGPATLRGLRLHGPLVSACLERASLDLADGRVDDPLADSVVLPVTARRGGPAFGLTRTRKWAVMERDVPTLRAWLATRASRGLVYGYRGEP
ncbi:MAG: hypothetical protein Q8P18_14220 [Pseudomonadota bacterium]|nr:hypothetical protein [Pseudomonadota bacterium]